MNQKIHIYEKKYKMFHKLFEEQDEIPDYRMYMADGFRESHGYTQNGEIETIRMRNIQESFYSSNSLSL